MADEIRIPDFNVNIDLTTIFTDNLKTPISKVVSDFERFEHYLRIGHLNTVSIPKHFDEIYRLIRLAGFDIFASSETNIKPSTPSHLFKMPGFTLIRNDRTHTTKGGVGVYFKEEYKPKKIKINYNNLHPEMVFAEVDINRNKVAIGVIYKTPAENYRLYADIQEILAFITTKYKHVILMGDYNVDLLKRDTPAEFFRNVVLEPFSLHDIIKEPTRYSKNTDTATCIDNILVTEPESVKMHGATDLPGISDHCLVYMAYNLKRPKFKQITVSRRDYRNFKKEDFIADMEIAPWGNIHTIGEDGQEIDLNDKVTVIENIFKENIDKHAPFRTVSIKRPINASWMTDDILELMDKRDLFKNLYNNYKEDLFQNEFKKLRNEVNHKIRKAKIDEFNQTINSKVKDSKSFHKALKSHNIVPSKKKNETKCCFDPNTLNNTFAANNNADVDFNKVSETIRKINLKQKKGDTFEFNPVSEVDVINAVKTLKSNSCGVDNISAFFVKLSINQSVSAITDLINLSFQTSTYPERWKQAIVIPIPKIDIPLAPSDYRPISLLSVLSKIIGKLASKQIVQYLQLHGLLDDYQSAYRAGHSTTTALLEVTDNIYKALDNALITIKVLLDFSKAFDKAYHAIMLAKLKHLGFANSALKWIKSYLTSRQQKVRTDQGFSDWTTLDNGVPQGSILGPLLFTILIIDIGEEIRNCFYHLYADDAQVYISGKREDILNLIQQLNSDLNRLYAYTTANNLTLNIGKCKYIILGSQNNLKHIKTMNLPVVKIAENPLERKTELYNLGKLLDETLSWKPSVDKLVSDAYGRLRVAYQAKNFLNKKSKALVVEYYILSQFNYGNILMQNLTQILITKIQRLQNACTRFVFGLRKFDHISQHFRQLNVLNMANRNKLQSLVLMHKIMNKKAPRYLCSKIHLRNTIHTHNTRGLKKIHIPSFRNTYGRDRFLRKIAHSYNEFMDLDGFSQNLSVATFKRKLKAHLLSRQ